MQAVLRPGRIDKLVEVPLPTTADKVEILRLATSAMALAEDVQLTELAALPGLLGASCATLVGVCRDLRGVGEAAYNKRTYALLFGCCKFDEALLAPLARAARHDSAEDFSRLNALLCTAMDRILIPVYCFANS